MEFEINGNEFSIKSTYINYNKIRKKYIDYANEIKQEFVDEYSRNNSLDDVVKNSYNQGSRAIAKIFDKSIKILIDKGIFTIDREHFIEKYYKKYHTWDHDFNKIYDQYMEIQLNQEELDEYRSVRRQSRGKVIGGGFGLEGAAKGMAQAGIINIVSGTAHGIFNGLGKIVSTGVAYAKKNSIYKDPRTLETLSNGIYNATFNIHLALVDAIKDNIDNPGIEYVDEKAKREAKAIFNNLLRTDNSVDTKEKLSIEILKLNPFFKDVYRFIFDNFGDKNFRLQELANYFAIDDLVTYKNKKLKNEVEPYSDKSIDELKKERVNIIRKGNNYGLKENQIDCVKVIDDKIADYNKEMRLVNGQEFKTIKEANRAKEDYKKLEKIDFNQNSINDLSELKKKIINLELNDRVEKKELKKIDEKIHALKEKNNDEYRLKLKKAFKHQKRIDRSLFMKIQIEILALWLLGMIIIPYLILWKMRIDNKKIWESLDEDERLEMNEIFNK